MNTSIRYGNTATSCNLTSAPNYVAPGYYNVYYAATYNYGGENMTENGVAYVQLYEDTSKNTIIQGTEALTIHYNCIGMIEIPGLAKLPDIDVTMHIRQGVELEYISVRKSA